MHIASPSVAGLVAGATIAGLPWAARLKNHPVIDQALKASAFVAGAGASNAGGIAAVELMNETYHQISNCIEILKDGNKDTLTQCKPELLASQEEILHPERFPMTSVEREFKRVCEEQVKWFGKPETARNI